MKFNAKDIPCPIYRLLARLSFLLLEFNKHFPQPDDPATYDILPAAIGEGKTTRRECRGYISSSSIRISRREGKVRCSLSATGGEMNFDRLPLETSLFIRARDTRTTMGRWKRRSEGTK